MPRRNRSKKMKGGFRFWPFGNSNSDSSSDDLISGDADANDIILLTSARLVPWG